MNGPRIGSMFTGYGGLDMVAQAVFGGEVLWVADNDPNASKLLAHNLPDTPNLGNLTEVDWSAVSGVDILTAGFPCTDISNAGSKAGIVKGKASGLWSEVVRAVRVLRPQLLILENVSAILVRGFASVIADLAALGYDLRWTCIQASEVGAPHQRDRWFAVAYPTASDTDGGGRGPEQPDLPPRESDDDGCAPAHADGGHGQQQEFPVIAAASVAPADGEQGTAGNSASGRRDEPSASDERDESEGADGGSDSHAADAHLLGREAGQGAPDASGVADEDDGERGALDAPDAASDPRRVLYGDGGVSVDWGEYGPAIEHWESVLGRPAPVPTMDGRRGTTVLNPAFTEWVMGLPEGWVTDVPSLTRPAMLRMLGNGVVRQQGEAAVRWLVSW